MDELSTEELVELFVNNPGIESENIEFKSKEILDDASGKRKIAKTASAMANTQGGSIIIGVRKQEDGKTVYGGFDRTDESELYLHQAIRDNTYPHMEDKVDIDYEEANGHRLLRIDVEKGYQNLVYFTGDENADPWKRVGSSNQQMSLKQQKEWKEARFSNVKHDLTESEDMVKKASAYSRSGYSFNEPEDRNKFEDQPDYFFLEKDNDRGLMNTLFRLPDDLLFGYQFEAKQLDIDHTNYKDFLRGFAETFPMRDDDVAFSITQEEGNWVGYGVKEFINCISDLEGRYKKYHENYSSHDSELAILTADTRFGMVTIYFYYYVRKEVPIFRRAEMYLSTEGVPYNTYPVSVFLEAFGSELKNGSRTSDDVGVVNGVGFGRHRQGKPEGIEVKPTLSLMYPFDSGMVPELNGQINRVVFENPFYDEEALARRYFGNTEYLDTFTSMKQLIGKLNYPVSDLEEFEFRLDKIRIYNTGKISGGQSITLDIDLEPSEVEE